MWPICRVLPIAPPTDYLRAAPPIDPDKQPVRARSGAALMIEIRRVFEANFCVYGMRKIWRQLAREGIVGARCRVARPCPRPRTGASLGSQLAILSSAVHRAPGRSGHRAVDDSDGNALAETINGLFEAEVIHRGAGRGAPSRPSSAPPWSGSSGTTTVAASRRSATSLPPRPTRAIMLTLVTKPWRPDPSQSASEKPRAVQYGVGPRFAVSVRRTFGR